MPTGGAQPVMKSMPMQCSVLDLLVDLDLVQLYICTLSIVRCLISRPADS
eukprot:COSAG02_NODE_7666_length_2904_cov_7.024242_2_plen_50_part_00